jgi:hypothetical protein
MLCTFSVAVKSSSPSSDIEDAELVEIGKSMESTLDPEQSTSEKDQKCTQALSSPIKEPVTVKTLSQLRSNISVQPGMYMFYTVVSFVSLLHHNIFLYGKNLYNGLVASTYTKYWHANMLCKPFSLCPQSCSTFCFWFYFLFTRIE